MDKKEAIEILRNMYRTPEQESALSTLVGTEWIENKDERIRKAITEMISDTDGGYPFEKYGVVKKEVLAWLEKQKETRYTKEEVLEELRIDLYNNDIYRVPEWLREALLMAAENSKKVQNTSLNWRRIEDATTKRTDEGDCVTTETMLVKGSLRDSDYYIINKDVIVNRNLLCIPIRELNAKEQSAEWSEETLDEFTENIRSLITRKLTTHDSQSGISSTVFIDDETARDIAKGVLFYVSKEAAKNPHREVPELKEDQCISTMFMRKHFYNQNKQWIPTDEQRFALGMVIKHSDPHLASTKTLESLLDDLTKLANPKVAKWKGKRETGKLVKKPSMVKLLREHLANTPKEQLDAEFEALKEFTIPKTVESMEWNAEDEKIINAIIIGYQDRDFRNSQIPEQIGVSKEDVKYWLQNRLKYLCSQPKPTEDELEKKYQEGYWKGYENGYKAGQESTSYHYPTFLPCYAPEGICTNPQMDCMNCPKHTTGGRAIFNTNQTFYTKDNSQFHWKPSNEQLKAFEEALMLMPAAYIENKIILKSLYNDLKKL